MDRLPRDGKNAHDKTAMNKVYKIFNSVVKIVPKYRSKDKNQEKPSLFLIWKNIRIWISLMENVISKNSHEHTL